MGPGPLSIVTVESRSLPAESVRRYGQGFYRSVSVKKGLKQRGEIATVGATMAFVDGYGRQNVKCEVKCEM